LGACQIRCPIAVIWTAFIGGLVAEKYKRREKGLWLVEKYSACGMLSPFVC